jgi:BirA family transcriptional regulator, biotin operon repressor / biotin---[acetyl-CoA-carboxylase] ligase
MSSPWTDLSRPPLSGARLQRRLGDGRVWRDVRVIASTGSTNADVAAEARAGVEEGLVLLAEEQTGGRGRLARSWVSPARAGVYVSVLLRPTTPPASWPLLTLLTGLAVVEAVVGVGRVEAGLKWPNDVLVDGQKLAGILAERVDDAVVVGIGINVSTRVDELPATGTSLAIAGGSTDREIVAAEILRALRRRYVAWRDTDGSGSSVLSSYREMCETIGSDVTVELPGGHVVMGVASGVDDAGRLVVLENTGGPSRSFTAGDVTHVRRPA